VTSVLAHGSVLLAALVVLQRTTPPRPLAEVTVALQFVQPDASQTPAAPSPTEAATAESALPSPAEPHPAEPLPAAAEPPSEQLPPSPLEEPSPTPEQPAEPAPAERPAVVTKPTAEPPPKPTEPPKPRARFVLRMPSQAPETARGSTAAQSAAAIAPMLPAHPVAGMESDRPPVYPEMARRRGQQGRVLLQVNVSANGTPVGVTIAQSSGVASLDDAALRAVEQWRFVPATRGGTAVPAIAEVPVRFRLTN
jgi:periplasmic protein TonB